jgi:hypothetical protein
MTHTPLRYWPELALGRCRALAGTWLEWLKSEAGTNEDPA